MNPSRTPHSASHRAVAGLDAVDGGYYPDGHTEGEQVDRELTAEKHYPDGLNEEAIDALLCEVGADWDNAPVVTSGLLNGSAVQRRERREARRAIATVVRALPHRPVHAAPRGEVA